MLNTVWSDSSD